MKSLFDTFVGALKLDDGVFQDLKLDPNPLHRTFLLIIAVSLIANLGLLFGGIRNAFRDPEVALQEAQQEFRGSIEQLRSFLQDVDADTDFVLGNVEAGMRIGFQIARLKTPLPHVLSVIVTSMGRWAGSPFAAAAGWFSYTLMVLVAARLLGGRGNMPQTLALTGLSFAPQVVDLLGGIRWCGGLLVFAAWVYSAVIYLKALTVAQEMNMARAIIAWILPGVVIGLLITVGAVLFGVLMVFGIASAA